MAGTWLESACYIYFSQHVATDRCSMVVGILVSKENPLTLKSPAQSWFGVTLLAVPSGCSWSVNVRAAAVLQECHQPAVGFLSFCFCLWREEWFSLSWCSILARLSNCLPLGNELRGHRNIGIFRASKTIYKVTTYMETSNDYLDSKPINGGASGDSLNGICGLCNLTFELHFRKSSDNL